MITQSYFSSTALESLKLELRWLCVLVHVNKSIVCVGDRCLVRRQPNCGFLMMRCLQKLWPRSEPHLVTFDDILHLFAEFCLCICCVQAETKVQIGS